MTQWIIDATVRSTRRVDQPMAQVLAETLTARCGSARFCGAQGLSVQLRLEADTRTAAGGAALVLLAIEVLPLLEGAALTDLRVVSAEHSVSP